MEHVSQLYKNFSQMLSWQSRLRSKQVLLIILSHRKKLFVFIKMIQCLALFCFEFDQHKNSVTQMAFCAPNKSSLYRSQLYSRVYNAAVWNIDFQNKICLSKVTFS